MATVTARGLFLELDFDLHDDLLSYDQAATLTGVRPARIRVWVHRGHLAPAGRDRFGRPLFTGLDVLRALARTERRGRRVA